MIQERKKNKSLIEKTKLLTIASYFSPAGDPAWSVVKELTSFTGEADGPDEVGESDLVVELHQGDIIVKQRVVIVWMDNDLGHTAWNLVSIWASLSLFSKVEGPLTQRISALRETTHEIKQ